LIKCRMLLYFSVSVILEYWFEYQGTIMFWNAQITYCVGTWYHSWLRHYATSRKVVGSILNEVIGFFNWPNTSSRTMALGSTQPLTEMSTRNLLGVKGGWHVRLRTSLPSVSRLYIKCEILDVSHPMGLHGLLQG
jgi:hypothetical protein